MIVNSLTKRLESIIFKNFLKFLVFITKTEADQNQDVIKLKKD